MGVVVQRGDCPGGPEPGIDRLHLATPEAAVVWGDDIVPKLRNLQEKVTALELVSHLKLRVLQLFAGILACREQEAVGRNNGARVV